MSAAERFPEAEHSPEAEHPPTAEHSPTAEHCQVSTTVDAPQLADDLAGSAVRARVAACAQVSGPVASVYRWQGEVRSATEWLVTFKTSADRCAALVEHVRALHGYEVPEIIVTPIVGGDTAYLAWVTEQTRP